MENPPPRPVSGKKLSFSAFLLPVIGAVIVLALLWPLRNRVVEPNPSEPAPQAALIGAPILDDEENEVKTEEEPDVGDVLAEPETTPEAEAILTETGGLADSSSRSLCL